MITVTTTNETNTYQEIANTNSYLLEEGESIKIKTVFGQRIYQKVDGKMQLKK